MEFEGTEHVAGDYEKVDIASVSEDSNSKESEKGGITFSLLFASYIFFLSQFQFGYSIGELNSAENFIPVYVDANFSSHTTPVVLNSVNKTCGNMQKWFKDCLPFPKNLEHTLADPWTWLVSIFPLGAFFGALLNFPLSSYLGRKYTTFAIGFSYTAGYLLQVFFSDFWAHFTGRLLLGVSAGVSSGNSGTYLNEVAPSKYRGFFAFIPEVAINVGILVAQAISLLTHKAQWWRLLLGWVSILAVSQIVFVTCVPYSPRWILSRWKRTRENEEVARRNLEKLRGTNTDVSFEFRVMKLAARREKGGGMGSLSQFRMPIKKVILHFAISVGLQFIQQFSGINAVALYSTKVFNKSDIKLPIITPEVITVIFSFVCATSVIASTLFVDRVGRKPLLLVGMSVQCISLLFLTASFCALYYGAHLGDIWEIIWGILTLFSIVVYGVFFSIALGPVPWMIFGEIFTTKWRVAAATASAGMNWFCAFVVGLTFPRVNHELGHFSFLPFAVVLAIGVVFIAVLFKETKGKSIEEICLGEAVRMKQEQEYLLK